MSHVDYLQAGLSPASVLLSCFTGIWGAEVGGTSCMKFAILRQALCFGRLHCWSGLQHCKDMHARLRLQSRVIFGTECVGGETWHCGSISMLCLQPLTPDHPVVVLLNALHAVLFSLSETR